MCKVFFNEATAASFNAYVYSPPTKKSKMNCGHPVFVDTGAAFVTVPKVEVIKKSQSAQIELLIQEQNCGFLNFEGERLFFHGSQMIGNVISELETGDVLNFDVVYNPRTSKFLAKNVRRVESVRAKKNLGHFQMMQVSETNEKTQVSQEKVSQEKVSHLEEENAENEEVCQGKITKITAQYGFIDEDVFFHYSSLVGTHMSELQVGTCLNFKARMNKSNTRKVASGVRKAEISTPEITTTPELQVTPELRVTPEIQTIKNILALEGANLLRRLSKNLIVNEQKNNCDEEVENIMQHIKVDALGGTGAGKNSLTPAVFTDSLRNSRRGSAIGFR
jgi:cold shock CspA family protein